ncbi:MAG: hypothetical protein ABSB19_12105 [Methylomonas sp.]
MLLEPEDAGSEPVSAPPPLELPAVAAEEPEEAAFGGAELCL